MEDMARKLKEHSKETQNKLEKNRFFSAADSDVGEESINGGRVSKLI